MAWLVKRMGLGLKMFTNYVWTVGSGVDSGNRGKAQRGHGRAKEQERGWRFARRVSGLPLQTDVPTVPLAW